MELCNIYNESVLMDILSSRPHYSIMLENIEILKEASVAGKMIIITEAGDQAKSKKAAEAYIHDVKEFVSKHTDKADILRNKSKIYAWLSLGAYFVGIAGCGVAGAAGAFTLAPILYCLGILTTLVSGIMSIITADQARKEILKLKPVKKQLTIHRDRIEDHDAQDKLDKLIIKIESITDRVSDDTATERVSAHSF